MQKILKTIIGGAILASTLSADIARVEMGVGVWAQTPVGSLKTTDNSNILSLDGTYTTAENNSAEMYAWVIVKHPIPVIPNLRLEYVSISDEGLFIATPTNANPIVSPLPINSVPYSNSTINMTQFDIIPYYNFLDNTGWITVDLGLDIKVIQADIDIKAVNESWGISPAYTSSESIPIPLLYLRGRVQIPATEFGIESDIKFISDGDSTFYDIRAKVDYTFDITPIIQPAIEVGYRTQSYDINSDDTIGVIEYSGVYAGVMLRF